MAIKKFADLANETDSKFNNIKGTKSREQITERFDDTTHNEQPSDEALQYLNKKLEDNAEKNILRINCFIKF